MTIDKTGSGDLVTKATQILRHAHAPYSGYRAGASMRLRDGRIFSGCPVENPAYAQGCDAVETAAGIMIAAGWVESGALPEIAAAVICCESVDERFGWLPGMGGRTMLELFGTPETVLEFATRDEGVFENLLLKDIAAPVPGHFLNRDKYPGLAMARMKKEKSAAGSGFAGEPLQKLFRARLEAFCPVSLYAVGAMVETADGRFFYGCNVETGPNTCLHAEANAIAAMVAALGPEARIARVSVLTAGNPGFPCGDCRQRIYEFALPETEVVAMSTDGKQQKTEFRKLFPHSFGRADLDSAHEASDEAA